MSLAEKIVSLFAAVVFLVGSLMMSCVYADVEIAPWLGMPAFFGIVIGGPSIYIIALMAEAIKEELSK